MREQKKDHESSDDVCRCGVVADGPEGVACVRKPHLGGESLAGSWRAPDAGRYTGTTERLIRVHVLVL